MSDVFLEEFLNQAAVYWAKIGVDNYGNPTFSDPIEISCRWEDIINEVVDASGTTIISKTKVLVDRDVLVGGVLYLGELESAMTSENVEDYSDAYEIKVFGKVPNIDADEFVRIVYL